jgi:4-amino-4-deoxy-L-arabinose transferase-like glycosyltransferase
VSGLEYELPGRDAVGAPAITPPVEEGGLRWPVPPVVMVAAFALATSLFITFVISSGGSAADGGFDPYYFGDMGKSIANGDGFAGFGSLITRRAPLYPIFIGGIYFVFGDHARVVLFFQCLLFAGTAVLAYDLARRHFNERTGVIAGALIAVNPLLLRYVPSLHLETFLTFLVTLMIWCTYRFWRRPTLWIGAAVGLTAGLAALTKAVVLLYPLVFVVALLLTVRAARKRGEAAGAPWKPIIAIFVVMAATIAPWTIRNYGTTGHVVLVSSGTSDAFLRGFIFSEWRYATLQDPPYTDAENRSNAYFKQLAKDAGTVWERDDYETDQILNKEAKRRLLHEPGQVLRKTVTGVFTFWYQLTSLKNSLLVLVCAIGAWALAIIGWRRARREHRPVWMFLLPVFYLNTILALLLALGRYSAPILPALLIVSAFGVDTLLQRWRPADA